MRGRRARLLLVLALALLSSLGVLFHAPGVIRVAAGLLLFGVLPGYLLALGWVPGRSVNVELERVAVGIGASFALSIVFVLWVQWLPGELTVGRILVANALALLVGLAGSLLAPGPVSEHSDRTSRRVLAALAAVLLLAGLLRIVNLGYSEFQDDEVDVAQVSLQAILGDKDALLTDTRGPARTVVAASFFTYADRTGELDVRLPTALASLAGLLTVYCLGRRLLGLPVGLAAAAIVAVEGIILGYGRIVQQESFVNLFAALAVWCFWVARERRWSGLRVLGALFFAVGVLAHYEMALLVPLLAWLWLSSVRPERVTWPAVLGIPAIVLGTFYVPFVLHPGIQSTYDHYAGDILGRGMADNLAQFLSVTSFYNSVYLVAVVLLLAIAAVAVVSGGNSRGLRWLFGVGTGALFLGSLLAPGRLALPGLAWWGVLILLALTRRSGTPEGLRLAFWWLALYFVPYVYVVGLPRMHFYTFTFPLALLAGFGLIRLFGALNGPPARAALLMVSAAIYLLAVYHAAAFFVSHQPEWAMVQPSQAALGHPVLHGERPGERFGFPQASGWGAVAELYRQGRLRGSYETNELYQKADWYLRRIPHDSTDTRYYFVAESPHRVQAGPPPAPFAPGDYRLIGTISVAGAPKLSLYERGWGETTPVTYQAEEMRTPRALDDYRLWRRNQADDAFFQEVADFLSAAGRPGDGLILDAGQSEILSYYYRGELPYLTASVLEPLTPDISRVFALFWASNSKGRTERLLDERLFKAEERWFGNLRLALYAVPPGGPVDAMQQTVGARLGDSIRLLGYSLGGDSFSPGQILPLSLYWEAGGKVSVRYKVFVHVSGSDGRPVAQRDSEPGGGSLPTDEWRSGDRVVDNQGVLLPESLPAGRYELTVGLYDPVSGTRLPALDVAGARLPDDRITLGPVEVQSR